jgi:hypothetical protein
VSTLSEIVGFVARFGFGPNRAMVYELRVES